MEIGPTTIYHANIIITFIFMFVITDILRRKCNEMNCSFRLNLIAITFIIIWILTWMWRLSYPVWSREKSPSKTVNDAHSTQTALEHTMKKHLHYFDASHIIQYSKMHISDPILCGGRPCPMSIQLDRLNSISQNYFEQRSHPPMRINYYVQNGKLKFDFFFLN